MMILMNMMMLMMVVIELETVIIIIMMKIQMIKMIAMMAYAWMATVVLYLHVHWTVNTLRRLVCNPLSVHSHTALATSDSLSKHLLSGWKGNSVKSQSSAKRMQTVLSIRSM